MFMFFFLWRGARIRALMNLQAEPAGQASLLAAGYENERACVLRWEGWNSEEGLSNSQPGRWWSVHFAFRDERGTDDLRF